MISPEPVCNGGARPLGTWLKSDGACGHRESGPVPVIYKKEDRLAALSRRFSLRAGRVLTVRPF